MWLEVEATDRWWKQLRTVWWTQCIRSKGVVGGRTDRGLYDGRNVSGVGMCLEVGEIGDCMVDAMYKEQGCGWM